MGELTYLAERLKDARLKSGVSAKDAGESVGRSDRTIYAWENASSEPSAEQLIVLCRVYGVDITYFFPPELSCGNVSGIERTIIERYRDLSADDKAVFYGLLEALSK